MASELVRFNRLSAIPRLCAWRPQAEQFAYRVSIAYPRFPDFVPTESPTDKRKKAQFQSPIRDSPTLCRPAATAAREQPTVSIAYPRFPDFVLERRNRPGQAATRFNRLSAIPRLCAKPSPFPGAYQIEFQSPIRDSPTLCRPRRQRRAPHFEFQSPIRDSPTLCQKGVTHAKHNYRFQSPIRDSPTSC